MQLTERQLAEKRTRVLKGVIRKNLANPVGYLPFELLPEGEQIKVYEDYMMELSSRGYYESL